MMTTLRDFFSATEGSVKGFLNPEELYRSILTALGSGTTIGLVILLLQTIMSDAGAIFPDPTVSTLVTGLLTLVIDLLRRLNQGGKPIVGPTPVPIPTTN